MYSVRIAGLLFPSCREKLQSASVDPYCWFPAEQSARGVARALYEHVRTLPLVSPHGHTKAEWFARNEPFPDPAQLIVQSDHYIFRMLYSHGIALERHRELAIGGTETRGRPGGHLLVTTTCFAERLRAFGWISPSRNYLGWTSRFRNTAQTSTSIRFQTSCRRRKSQPRALYERFNLEKSWPTTDSPLDSLEHHREIRESDWKGRILPTFRPDPVIDPECAGFGENLARLGQKAREDTASWCGYLKALQAIRREFREAGCTATDHGHPTANTADLSNADAEALFLKVVSVKADALQKELFRAQMLTEMARMRSTTASSCRFTRAVHAIIIVIFTSNLARTWVLIFLHRRITCKGSARCLIDWKREEPCDYCFYARRINLQPGIGPVGRALPMPAAGTTVVVPR